MAVYTSLTQKDYDAIAAAFGLGRAHAFRFVPQGSINTNAFVETDQGRFFVRHTTVRSEDDLRYEAALLEHLRESRFPAPRLLYAGTSPFVPLRGGRVSVFGLLAGSELSRDQLRPEHLEHLGALLAKMHLSLNAFTLERANPYGRDTVAHWLAELRREQDAEVSSLAPELEAALERARLDRGLLPRGTIHADLFMDNVKWVGDRVSAFFDFEMACRDVWVLDVAITLNAWCFQGGYQEPLCRAFARGYLFERPMDEPERAALFDAALFGAVRYTASRIRDFHLSKLPPDKLAKKDYRTYLARVRALEEMGPEGFGRLVFG